MSGVPLRNVIQITIDVKIRHFIYATNISSVFVMVVLRNGSLVEMELQQRLIRVYIVCIKHKNFCKKYKKYDKQGSPWTENHFSCKQCNRDWAHIWYGQ